MKNYTGATALSVIALTLLASARPVWAQSSGQAPPDNSGQLKPPATGAVDTNVSEIVVTAQKRKERLSTVPAAVTAVQSQQLVTAGAVTDRDLVARIPSLQVGGGYGSGTFVFRGLNTGVASSPTVGTEIDGAPIGATSFGAVGAVLLPQIDPSTIDRIEALRGPQGTVYAGNTLGGIINYVTRKPSLVNTDGTFYVEGSDTAGGAGNASVRGMVNTPLVTDKVGIQLSAFGNYQDGFIDALVPGRNNYNYNHAYGGRAAVLWQVSPSLRIEVSDLYSNVHSYLDEVVGDPATSKPVGPDLTTDQGVLPKYDNRFNIGILAADLDVGSSTLSYIGTLQNAHSDWSLDYTNGGLHSVLSLLPLFGGVPVSSTDFIAVETPQDISKTTQELRFASPDSGRLRWLFGAYYGYESSLLAQNAGVGEPDQSLKPGPASSLLTFTLSTHLTEYAGFGNVTYYITPKLDVNYLANVRYTFSPSTMAYFRFSTGVRVGGPNTVAPGLPATFGPDSTDNYELGLKSSLLNNRLYVELTCFDVEWRNIQVLTLSQGGTSGEINGGRAFSRGFEGSLTARLLDALSLSAWLVYDDAKLKDDIITAAGIVGLKGDQLPNAPKWSGALSAEYEWTIREGLVGFVGSEVRYNGSREAVPRRDTVYPPTYLLPSYVVADVRAGLRFHKYELAVFARNVGNSRAQLGATPAGVPYVILQRPRTIGASVSAQF